QDMLQAGQIPQDKLVRTFNMVFMTDSGNLIPDSFLSTINTHFMLGLPARFAGFLLLFIGFAIKIPVVPFHTWLPDAHVEAPTPISVILAGVLLKIGGYGLFRTAYLIFPDGAINYAWWVGGLGVVSIIYGAFNALASKDLKRLIAFSSVSHMGFVLLGLAALSVEGVSGAIYQMISHGFISAALFLIAGVIYDRTADRLIENYSGLASQMPKYTVIVVIFFFASLGLPGFSGFIAEILVLLGSFGSAVVEGTGVLPKWMTLTAVFGLILSAAYYLWTIQRMFFGKYHVKRVPSESIVDLNRKEFLMFIPLVIFVLVLGIFPSVLLDLINNSVVTFVDTILNF
ncbi:MAG: NADH-quinone oxidoreductase subunit M, partial [Bacteroidota bacterium]